MKNLLSIYTMEMRFVKGSFLIPIVISLLWAGLALFIIGFLSSNREGWQDRHRFALIFGAVLANMIGGTVGILADSSIDKIGKLVVDLMAFILLILLAWRLRKQREAKA